MTVLPSCVNPFIFIRSWISLLLHTNGITVNVSIKYHKYVGLLVHVTFKLNKFSSFLNNFVSLTILQRKKMFFPPRFKRFCFLQKFFFFILSLLNMWDCVRICVIILYSSYAYHWYTHIHIYETFSVFPFGELNELRDGISKNEIRKQLFNVSLLTDVYKQLYSK